MHTDQDLQQSIEDLRKSNRQLVVQQSLWRSFWRGVVSGVGATVGAAVVISVVVGLLNWLSGYELLRPLTKTLLPYVENVPSRSLNRARLPEASYQTLPEATPALPSPEAATTPSPSSSAN